MAEDKPGDDDLFEDLDKFFAPIKDVDWDEPAEPGSKAPEEEHVAVHAPEATPEPEPSPDPEPSEPAVASTTPEPPDAEEAAWYDTSVMAPIDDLLGEGDLSDEGEPEGEPREEQVEIAGQHDLFASSEAEEASPAAAPEAAAGFGAGEDSVSRETQPLPTFLDAGEGAPAEADLEAAARHFSEDTPDEPPADPTEHIVPFDDDDDEMDLGTSVEAGDDLLTDPSIVEDDILADLEDSGAPRTVIVGTDEGLGGPSWQEATSVEVGADLDRRGVEPGERDVPAAFMTGILLAGIAIGTVWIGKGVFAVVATLMVLMAQGELYAAMAKRRMQPATAIGLVSGALMMAGAYFHGEAGLLAMFALGTIATFLWYMTVPAAHRAHVLQNIGLTVMNMAWIPLMGGYVLVMLGLSDGKALVISIIALTFVYDTAAFLFGSIWGGTWVERPLAPNTSPKKSWEGFIGALVVTLILAMVLMPSAVSVFTDHKLYAALLGIMVGLAATFGDLAESLVKRDLGIKDMGSILPGHGGILDRIDSLLFVAPAAFLVVRIVFG